MAEMTSQKVDENEEALLGPETWPSGFQVTFSESHHAEVVGSASP